MDNSFWTVAKVRDLLEGFSFVHQHAIMDSLRILHHQEQIVIMIRDTPRSEPKEVVYGPKGLIEMRGASDE